MFKIGPTFVKNIVVFTVNMTSGQSNEWYSDVIFVLPITEYYTDIIQIAGGIHVFLEESWTEDLDDLSQALHRT